MFVGIQVVIENVPRLITRDHHTPSAITIVISAISGIIMFAVYIVNRQLAKKTIAAH